MEAMEISRESVGNVRSSVGSAIKGALGWSIDEYLAFASTAGACSMVALGALSVFDMALSMAFLTGLVQCVVLLLGGLVCLEGERSGKAELLQWRHEFVREYFGFAMAPLGRGAVYSLAVLQCIGIRALEPGQSALFSTFWYVCCMVMITSVAAILWAWRHPQHSASLLDVNSRPNGEAENIWEDSGPYRPPV
mmetsp:Transcript_79162/g.153003  ORF Transcript_79162/g.153003 Transcript_79162/m.153003 type:complete len:193 (+) Transcript_79162:29-607(+)